MSLTNREAIAAKSRAHARPYARGSHGVESHERRRREPRLAERKGIVTSHALRGPRFSGYDPGGLRNCSGALRAVAAMAINVAEECKAELARTGLATVAPDVAATAVELLRHVAPLLFDENEVRGMTLASTPSSCRRFFRRLVPRVRGRRGCSKGAC